MASSTANFFPPGLSVRSIRPADNDAVRALFIRGQSEFVAPESPLDVRMAAKRYIDSCLVADLARPHYHYSQPRRKLWVLESQAKEIVAMAAVNSSDDDSAAALLCRLVVSPEFRRKGVARLLIQQAERWASQQGFRVVRLDTTEYQLAAIALYESLGYVNTGSEMYGPIPVRLMEKRLTQ